MNAQRETSRVSRGLIAEAGVWIARLNGPHRDASTDAAFRRWLRDSPAHTRAFELASDVWEDAQLLSRVAYKARAGRRIAMPWRWATAAILACVAIAAVVLFFRASSVITGVGEQRLLTMEDGTRVFLNTDTRIIERYDKRARRIELLSGEALFEVAKRKDWPFLVIAGSRQIKAVGTAFAVRYEPGQEHTAVTLVEGKVTVSAVSAGVATGPGDREPEQHDRLAMSIVVTAGERLTFASTEDRPVLDRPSIERAVAWRRGQVSLDDMPLADAVTEMNRYNARRVVIEDPRAGTLHVNGLFQTGDSESFARAVADTYGLRIVEERDRIIITGTPLSH